MSGREGREGEDEERVVSGWRNEVWRRQREMGWPG